MLHSTIEGINVDELLTYLERENQHPMKAMIGYKFPTQADHVHHSSIELLCGKCGNVLNISSLEGSERQSVMLIKQMDRPFISIQIMNEDTPLQQQSFPLEFGNLRIVQNHSSKDLIIQCKNCSLQIGTASFPNHQKKKAKMLNSQQNDESQSIPLNGKLFWKDIFSQEGCEYLILLPKTMDLSHIPFSTKQSVKASQQAAREPNEIRFKKIIQRQLEEEERIRNASTQDPMTATENYQAHVREAEIAKRKMFKRLHNLKMSDHDLENDTAWEQWLFWYRDKKIPTLYNKFNQLLKDEFHGNVRAVRKIEEVIKGHILENLQLHPSVLKLKCLVESDNENDKFELRSILHKRIFNETLIPSPSFEILPYSSSVCEEHYKGKFFCFIDLAKANFSTLRTLDPDIFGASPESNMTWRQFLNKETTFELFHNFHYTIRHPVFGKLNHGFSTRKMIEIAEHEQLNVLYNMMKKHLLKEHAYLFEESHCFVPPMQCASDAFFFCFHTEQDAKIAFDALCQFDSELYPNVKDLIHLTVFKNHYYYFSESNSDSDMEQQRWFVVKETLHSQEVCEEKFTICAVQLEDRPFIEDHFERALALFSKEL